MALIPQVYRTSSQPLVPRVQVITDVSAFYSTTGADPLAVGDDVVAGCVYNVLSTLVGDEPFLPTFGCDLPKRVFEPLTAKVEQQMKLDAYMALKQWVPFITMSQQNSGILVQAGNRVAGVTVAYSYNGSWWVLPVYLTQIQTGG